MNDTPKEYLFIVKDGPYGSERPYHALRLAIKLLAAPETLDWVGEGECIPRFNFGCWLSPKPEIETTLLAVGLIARARP